MSGLPSWFKILLSVAAIGLAQLFIMELSSKNGGLLTSIKKEL